MIPGSDVIVPEFSQTAQLAENFDHQPINIALPWTDAKTSAALNRLLVFSFSICSVTFCLFSLITEVPPFHGPVTSIVDDQ
jgi:hypothetical protein